MEGVGGDGDPQRGVEGGGTPTERVEGDKDPHRGGLGPPWRGWGRTETPKGRLGGWDPHPQPPRPTWFFLMRSCTEDRSLPWSVEAAMGRRSFTQSCGDNGGVGGILEGHRTSCLGWEGP